MNMNKIRPKQKRSPSLEVLEGRLTLSTGLAVDSPHTHALVRSLPHGAIPVSFRGHTSTSGSTQTTPDLTGRIGHDRFTGYGSATVSGAAVLGGDVYLSNRKGSLHLKLDSVSFTQVGRSQRPEVPFVVVEATGKYASFAGATGIGTAWNVPANPERTSTFSGFVELA
jgi:hypothetical protein